MRTCTRCWPHDSAVSELRVERGGQRVAGPLEHRDQGVALTLLEWPKPPVGGNRGPDDLRLTRHGRRRLFATFRPQSGRVGDVGQQERHHTQRQRRPFS